jgi:hypothetical protein
MREASRLYDEDFHAWTEVQAAESRRLAARPELSNAIDWSNVIEEIETLRRDEWRAVESWLENSLVHILKGYVATNSPSFRHWENETAAFLESAGRNFRPSIRPHLDIGALWSRAAKVVVREFKTFGGSYLVAIAPECPFTLAHLLDRRFAFDGAIRHLLATNGGNAPFEFPANSVQ